MEKKLNELTDQELLDKNKKIQSGKIINAVLLGFLIGVAIYSTIKNGVGIFTLLPLVFVAFTINAWKKDNQALKDELKSRNLI